MKGARMIVVGLDGASWRLLDKWIEDGELPTLSWLKTRGSWGLCLSQLPTVTCPNWKCYSTGKNPGKLGVFWWKMVDKKRRTLVGYDSRSFRSKEIFDYLGEAGYRVGVLNMPTTYPPKEVRGYMVSGPPDAIERNYTYPPSFQEELEEKFGYRILPKSHIASIDDIFEYADEILDLVKLRFEVARWLAEKVDFLHVTVFYINVLQHFLYDHELTLEAWKIIDDGLKSLFSEERAMILLSDHGTHPVDTVFYVNSWLERMGYLVTRKSPLMELLLSMGLTKERVVSLANRFGIAAFLEETTPSPFRYAVPSQDGTIMGTADITEKSINWQKSKALGTGQGTIYVLSKRRSKQVRDSIIEKLKEVRVPGSDKGVAKSTYPKESVYSGPYVDLSPDIVYQQEDGVYSAPGIGRREVFDTSKKWKAENHIEGMFLIAGPGIKKGMRIDRMSILDIAPTILTCFGVDLPDDLDGRLLNETFEESFSRAEENKRPTQIPNPKNSS